MNFRQITYGSQEYERAWALREEGLRAPLGLSLRDENLAPEKNQLHFGLFEPDGTLVACVIAVPLAALGLKPAAGMTLKADIGVLRGDGMQTTQRVYWSNKGTGITSDVPSEAMLTPSLWGKWVFVPQD